MKLKIGLDIGGTKCAISTGECEYGAIKILSREEFPTAGLSWRQVLEEFACRIERIVSSNSNSDLQLSAIGISCGGPLDSKRGVIMSPPNLPGWDNVPVVDFFKERFGVPVSVQNDANACALAEYLYGSGRGAKNMVFMTFGTGLGAGIVIDGKLYSGANDNAGEIGHIRLANSSRTCRQESPAVGNSSRESIFIAPSSHSPVDMAHFVPPMSKPIFNFIFQ